MLVPIELNEESKSRIKRAGHRIIELIIEEKLNPAQALIVLHLMIETIEEGIGVAGSELISGKDIESKFTTGGNA